MRKLAQLPLTVGLQHFKSVLGYPTGRLRVERECVGYPLTVSLQPSKSAPGLVVLLGDEFWDDQGSDFDAINLWS